MEKLKWVSTKEKLPPIDTEVLVVVDRIYITVGELTSYDNWRVLGGLGTIDATCYFDKKRITYWMSYPELPYEDD